MLLNLGARRNDSIEPITGTRWRPTNFTGALDIPRDRLLRADGGMPADERDCGAGEPAAEVMSMRTGLAVFLLLTKAGQAEPARAVDLKAPDGTALKHMR